MKIELPGQEENAIYLQVVDNLLKKIFKKDNSHSLDKHLPLIACSEWKEPPFILSFYLLCHFRRNAYRFFYEMLSRWLIPGKQFNILMQFAIDFRLPELSDATYIGGEVTLLMENERDLLVMKKNLPTLETEMRLGIVSSYQANRILEIKGLTPDEKTAMIQEKIASLVKRRPQDLDYDIFCEMQHFLVLCKEEFKVCRDYRHMSRIICVLYLFRKALRHSSEAYIEKRFISVKLIRAKVYCNPGCKAVLGIAVGISFLREHEYCEERHIVKAASSIIPEVILVQGSFFLNTGRGDPTRTYYFEIEKENGSPFHLDEERLLKKELPVVLKRCIEEKLNPIFMPQNEEEIVRNIIRLSGELRFVRDLPQVMISFEGQTQLELEYLVIVIRLGKESEVSYQKLFSLSFLQFIPDRVKPVGFLRKKYTKEANVFRVRLKKTDYLRQDHSVDLYRARQDVAQEIRRIIGDYRDFNGGMLAKENELFALLRDQVAKKNGYLLENFFYTLSPPLMRSLLPLEVLKKMFNMLLEAGRRGVEIGQRVVTRIEEEKGIQFMAFVGEEKGYFEPIEQAIDKLRIPTSQLATTLIVVNDYPCLGVIYRVAGVDGNRLRDAIEEAISVISV